MTVGGLYILGAGLAFVAIFVTGLRLSVLKKTRNTMLLSAHKISALCVVVLLVVTAVRVNGLSRLEPIDWAVVAAAAALWIATAASGGLISAREAVERGVRVAHRVTAILTVLASAAALYLLLVQI